MSDLRTTLADALDYHCETRQDAEAAANAVAALVEDRIRSERARLLADSSWVLEQSILEQVHASGYAQALADARTAIEGIEDAVGEYGYIDRDDALAALDALKREDA